MPGTDDTWMTPSTINPRTPHTVKLFSSGRVNCDKDCPNYRAYSICSHAVAVADQNGILGKFVKWHRKNKGGTNLTALANVGMPTSSGKNQPPQPREERVQQTHRGGSLNWRPLPVDLPTRLPTIPNLLNLHLRLVHSR